MTICKRFHKDWQAPDGSCAICRMITEIARLTKERDEAREEVRALREALGGVLEWIGDESHDDDDGCPDDCPVRLARAALARSP